jgi:excisionase family DNA binding protein
MCGPMQLTTSGEQTMSAILASPGLAKLLLTPREAAQALAISERHLWGLTKAGTIKAIRLGRAVRYRADSLAQFAAEQENGGGK